MKVLVTGGAGYIGSAVVEELVRGGEEVVVLDDLRKGHRDAVPASVPFVQLDLLDAPRVRAALADHAIEAVVHLAADSLVGESVQDPAKYYRNNVGAGLVLLDSMRAQGVEQLVFSSSAAVYGEPARQPVEEHDALAPTNPYGETKLAFERALHWYGRAYGLRHASLRYFNAAGATGRCGERHDPESHLIPLVLGAALGRTPAISVFGDDYPTPDGTCVRDYIHVHDLAVAHVLALRALSKGKAALTYNLGCGGEGYSVRQVIDVARKVTGREIPVRVGPRRPGDPAVLVASSARIGAELGWRPEHQSLEEIVASAWRFLLRPASQEVGAASPGHLRG